jgi:pimeloyl-ACP methyl ester carboxylesterase
MSVEPFYFGNRDLFGLYRPASPAVPARRHLVVVCNAALHEYFKIQHVARQLSEELSDQGFDVLRFDFSGQGNSGGDLARFHWIDDLRVAVQEGTEVSGAIQTSIVGFRAGALVAAAAGLAHRAFVAWDPVFDGAAYMEQLRGVHDALLKAHAHLPDAARDSLGKDEFLGYRLGDDFVSTMQSLHLDWDRVDADRRCMVLSEMAEDGSSARAKAAGVELAHEPFICHWDLPSSRLLFAHDVVAKLKECLL